MGRIKPQALLLQSKRKKAPAKINVATIIFCNIAIILLLFFFVAVHRHRSKSGRPLLSGFNHLQGDRKLKLPLDQSNTEVQYAIINTSMGTISLELYVKEAPKAVENFLTHSRNGYYNGVLFHRVIKGFMIQAGDPKGDGTGGESIWGGFFEDEFNPSLKHEPFTLSMANKGPNSNGSQFFITSVATPHLDNHHTVFGHVVKGQDVVKQIESVQTDEKDRPLSPVKINDISIVDEL